LSPTSGGEQDTAVEESGQVTYKGTTKQRGKNEQLDIMDDKQEETNKVVK
jgi:hypothetical protein